jgi:hypothetical protein
MYIPEYQTVDNERYNVFSFRTHLLDNKPNNGNYALENKPNNGNYALDKNPNNAHYTLAIMLRNAYYVLDGHLWVS